MSENTRPRRTYDTSGRRERAALTRDRIIEAARTVFLARGYVGATVPAIAVEAGVAVETVYRSAAGKAGLLSAAVEAALAGSATRAELPVEERPGIRRVIEATTPQRRLRAYAATQPGVWSRVGPLLRVLDTAAPADTVLVELRDRLSRQRWEGLRRFAQLLTDSGALRDDLTVDRATDLIWTLCGQANYDALVTVRNWSDQEYRDWLANMLISALLPAPS